MTETVEVVGESPLVAITQSSRATSLRDEEIEKMPRGRDFTTLATQAAGVNAQRKSGYNSLTGDEGSRSTARAAPRTGSSSTEWKRPTTASEYPGCTW